MISDITLGQYFPGNSILHKLDPRMKIILSTLFIVTIFVAKYVFAFVFITLLTLVMMAVSQIPFKVIWKAIKPIIIILIITSLINIFMTKGEHLLWEWKALQIYEEGLWRALFTTLRVVLLIISTCLLLTYTTSPIDLTDAIESLLSPLKKIKVPVHEFAMMMTIALRFIPTLLEETEKIMNAQKSRGAELSSGNLFKRIKAFIPIIIPLFISAFQRAIDLATAMECRCYRGGDGRSKYKVFHIKARDFVALAVFVVALAAVIVLNMNFVKEFIGWGYTL